MYPLIVSFYTDDWEYPQHAERLRRECDSLGLDHRIERRESRGGYLQNSCIKPEFIRDCLQEGCPVLWVDVDGSIFARPDWFLDDNWDFQARKMDKRHRKREWHVGTMWFNYNDRVMEFVSQWVKNTGAISDESALEKTWRQVKLKSVDIPPEYFQIESSRRPHLPDTVILHRISNSPIKRVELPSAIRRARLGVL